MALGRKTGGRRKGTRNKVNAEVAEQLERLGCNPIEGMALLAMDRANPPDLRGRMFSELAQYVAAKRKAIEVTGKDGAAQEHEHRHRGAISVDLGRLNDRQLAAYEAFLRSVEGEGEGAGPSAP